MSTKAPSGKLFDKRFRLERELGSGGFGVVYAAIEEATKRPVAIKIFRPVKNNVDHEALERFKREGRLSARISHPNAIEVFEHGVTSDGTAFIVMELLVGHNLGEELKQHHRLPARQTLSLLADVCDALAAAHALNVVHRDIKPENVFLHTDEMGREVIKVLDFGVAKSTSLSVTQVPLTMTGALVGTPYYVAPERVEGVEYDGRADVYSVGVMMFQLLTGHLPFGSSSFYSVVMAHLEMPIPDIPPELTDVPEEVANLARLAMTKNPAKRPNSVDFAAALRQTLAQLSGS